MKKLLLTATLSTLVLALTACSKPTQDEQVLTPETQSAEQITHTTPTESASSLPVADGAATSLDWSGEYEGIFPCASCEGIEVELQLNPDKTYELTQDYMGEADNKSEVKGTFSFDATNPSIITLDANAENRKFFIGENFVEALDSDGKKIESKLNYKLTKQPS